MNSFFHMFINFLLKLYLNFLQFVCHLILNLLIHIYRKKINLKNKKSLFLNF
jgi:hypothetical protein